MMGIGRYDRKEQVGVYDGNRLCFPAFSAYSAVRPDAKSPHDPLYSFAIAIERVRNTPGAVGLMVAQYLFNPYLECPILLVLAGDVVQG